MVNAAPIDSFGTTSTKTKRLSFGLALSTGCVEMTSDEQRRRRAPVRFFGLRRCESRRSRDESPNRRCQG